MFIQILLELIFHNLFSNTRLCALRNFKFPALSDLFVRAYPDLGYIVWQVIERGGITHLEKAFKHMSNQDGYYAIFILYFLTLRDSKPYTLEAVYQHHAEQPKP